MKHLDRRRKGQNGRPDMAVWVEFMNSKNLTLSIISGGFPHNLNEEEVRWLVGVLQEALAEGSSSPANFDESLRWAAGALERAHRPVTAANLCEVLGDQVNEHQAGEWLKQREGK